MKYWEIGEKNKFEIECYKLHLKLPYGDEKDKVVAGFVRDENENNKYYKKIIRGDYLEIKK